MVDRSKLPRDLVVRQVWVPERDSGARPIVYVTERRRGIAGAGLIALGVILGLTVLAVRAAFWLAFVSLLIAWAGVAYASGGRTGFYQLSDEGGLGEYLGRARPELGSMVARKPPR